MRPPKCISLWMLHSSDFKIRQDGEKYGGTPKNPNIGRKQGFFGFKPGFELPRPNPVEPWCRFADSSIFQTPIFGGPRLAKSAKIPAMPGSRSRHRGQLRANPFEACCRTCRVNAEGLILAPIGGRKDQNHHAPLRTPSKTAKIQKVGKGWDKYGLRSVGSPHQNRDLEKTTLWAQWALGPNGPWPK